MRHVRVIEPGLYTTVQDLGRWGWQSLGVPVAGPMDERSHRAANALAGNPEEAALLEITVNGPRLEAGGPCRIAATGASCTIATANGAAEVPCVLDLEAGAWLEVGPCRRGARVYLAFDGGIATPPVLGSRSTDVRSGLGGLDGRTLARGDVLPLGAPSRGNGATVGGQDEASLPVPRGVTVLRVVPGWHAAALLAALAALELTVDGRSDRVGIRLRVSGGSLSAPGGLASIPTAMGSIQVTPAGEVILLMADRQPIGGYAQAAVVAAADLPVAGQLTAGCRVRLDIVNPPITSTMPLTTDGAGA